MNASLLDPCVSGSFAGTHTFPQVVRALGEAGAERYLSDLTLRETTYHAADGSHHRVAWPKGEALAVADPFDPDAIGAALRSAQAGEIAYPEFLRRIAGAGVVAYTVHLKGRQALYLGRQGNVYVEPFPPVEPETEATRLVRELYAAFARRDLPRIFSLLSADVEIVQSNELPWGGRYQGHEGAKQFFAKLGSHIQSSLAIERYIASGDAVTAVGWTQGTVTANRAPFRVPVAHLWTLGGGRVVRVQFSIDNPAMLQALAAARA
ncbi:MAG TPA: nuclear transport factor 2 family protein [Opitutaceae bacterium]|jgi:hypothetical protein